MESYVFSSLQSFSPSPLARGVYVVFLIWHSNLIQMNPEKRNILPKLAFTSFNSRYQRPELTEGFQDITEVPFKVRLTAYYHLPSMFNAEVISSREAKPNEKFGLNIGFEYHLMILIEIRVHQRDIFHMAVDSIICPLPQQELYFQLRRWTLLCHWCNAEISIAVCFNMVFSKGNWLCAKLQIWNSSLIFLRCVYSLLATRKINFKCWFWS